MDLRGRYQLYSRLGLLLEAGVSLDRAMEILARRAADSGEQSRLARARQGLGEGLHLSEVMRNDPDAFPELDTEIIAAGEQSNSLSQALAKLGESLERSYRYRLKFRADNIYYAILIGVGFLLFCYFNFFINLTGGVFSYFKNWLGVRLVEVFWVDAIRFYIPIILLLLPLLYHLLRLLVPRVLDMILILFPWINRPKLLNDQVSFARAMALGLQSQLPLPQCFRLAAGTVANRSLRNSLVNQESNLKDGVGLGKALANLRGLPAILTESIALVEKIGGKPGEVFSDFAEETEEALAHSRNPFLQLIAFSLASFIVLYAMLMLVQTSIIYWQWYH